MSSERRPFRDIEQMLNQWRQQFDELTQRTTPFEFRFGELESMTVDLADHGDEFVVTADVPGFKKDDITVNVTDSMLRIRAEHEEEHEETEEMYLQQERSHRSMSRSLRLPEPVNADEVAARYQNGVLTVTLPKTEPSTEGQNIDVE